MAAHYGGSLGQCQGEDLIHHLRQQRLPPEGKPNLRLADFISPQRNYVGGFAVIASDGKIGEDQAEDHAARKGWDAETAKHGLRPNLGG